MSKPKIVVALLTKDQHFQALQAADAERAALRSGLELEIVYANNNALLQVEQLYRFVHAVAEKRPAAILVHAVAVERLAKVAHDAAAAGIGWISLGREAPYLAALRAEFPQLPVAAVATDQLEIGRIQGRQLRKLVPAGSRVLYVQGPPDTAAAQLRAKGLEEVIQLARIELKTLDGDWTESGGLKAVSSWLRLSSSQTFTPNAVCAQNDAMAIGAYHAFETDRPELLRRPITGCDGLPEVGQQLVREHKLAATVVVQSNAGPAVELLDKYLRAGALPSACVMLSPRAYPKESDAAASAEQ
jgi:simple sugar transport system substrate-binding protein